MAPHDIPTGERALLVIPDLTQRRYLLRTGGTTHKISDPRARHTHAEASAACAGLGIPARQPHIAPAPYAPPLPRAVPLRYPHERGVYHQMALRVEHRDWLRDCPTAAAELIAWLDSRTAAQAAPDAADAAEGGDLW